MFWFLLSKFLGTHDAGMRLAAARARRPQFPPRRALRRRTFDA